MELEHMESNRAINEDGITFDMIKCGLFQIITKLSYKRLQTDDIQRKKRDTNKKSKSNLLLKKEIRRI